MKKKNSQRLYSITVRVLVRAAAYLTATVMVFLIGYILIKGIPNINAGLFALKYNSVNVSLMPALVNTLIITVLSLIIAVPFGIFAAIYLVEYAKRGSKAVALIRLTTETLTGIPSIVFGLFGMLLFVTRLRWGLSLLAGTITISIMILPTIMRTTEEALKSVPDSYREASFGLGAGRLKTVFKIVLPSALPGILAGVILAIGRIVGESAALIYTAGTVAEIPDSLFSSVRTLAVHMYALSSEGLYINQTYATAVILIIIVIIINVASAFFAKKLTSGGLNA